MRLLSIHARNFGCYDELDFTFDGKALCLIYGPTGCGKSTLMDLACWALYGQTAKGGGVDDIRSWGAIETTIVRLIVETPTGKIIIIRKRGKQYENDLYWQEPGKDIRTKHRGKDITETQKLINTRLGCGPELFLSGAYSHEFSATGAFFTAKAKDRRALFENLADLNLPLRLADRAAVAKKDVRKLIEAAQSALQVAEGKSISLSSSIQDAITCQEAWIKQKDINLQHLLLKKSALEYDKESKIKEIEDTIVTLGQMVQPVSPLIDKHQALINKINKVAASKCPTCHAPVDLKDKLAYQKEAALVQAEITANNTRISKIESLKIQVAALKSSTNQYTDQLERIASEQDPFVGQIAKFKADLEIVQVHKSHHEEEAQALAHKIDCLSTLCDLASTLRAQLLHMAIGNIEAATNDYLIRFFDGEFRVGFIVTDSDDLEVSITKNGHECSYKQLSKGQRRLLVLCFTVAVMKGASERAGVDFNCIFLDEPTDGCDSELKVKAYALFEELATRHESVFVIDHSTELKELFSNRYKVELVGDQSEINHD